MNKEIFTALVEVLKSRKEADPEKSYVASLYAGGAEKINRKIMEEAFETTLASASKDTAHLTKEICDLFFHTLVLAVHCGVEIKDIEDELSSRFGISGHQEKKERNEEK